MSAEPIPLRRFYVYVLKNDAGDVFYVGRGTGGRMMQHIARSHSGAVNNVLSEAVAGDAKILAEVVSWHSSSKDAARAEAELIQSFPFGQLVNKALVRKPRPVQPPLERPGSVADARDILKYLFAKLQITQREAARIMGRADRNVRRWVAIGPPPDVIPVLTAALEIERLTGEPGKDVLQRWYIPQEPNNA